MVLLLFSSMRSLFMPIIISHRISTPLSSTSSDVGSRAAIEHLRGAGLFPMCGVRTFFEDKTARNKAKLDIIATVFDLRTDLPEVAKLRSASWNPSELFRSLF